MVRESDRQIDKWIDIQITRKKEKREKENVCVLIAVSAAEQELAGDNEIR